MCLIKQFYPLIQLPVSTLGCLLSFTSFGRMHTSRLVAYDQILLNAESHPLLIAAMLLRAVEKVGRPHILLQRNMLANMVMFSHGWNLTSD